MQTIPQERTTGPKAQVPSQSHTRSRETEKPTDPEVPAEAPGDRKQNPADPTRKDGDVTPIYADERYASGEDMEEPTPRT